MTVEEIKQLIEEINLRAPKDFKKMGIPQLSNELREVMEYERQIFQKIEDLEKKETQQDLIKYARIICRNSTQREISEIQEIYLKKIENEYLNSK